MSNFVIPSHFTPLPTRKPYTPEKPKGAKAMTIAVGFQCSDGIVLCADRQFTATGYYKYSGSVDILCLGLFWGR
jgi:20S proteasome alpha/beta subunit